MKAILNWFCWVTCLAILCVSGYQLILAHQTDPDFINYGIRGSITLAITIYMIVMLLLRHGWNAGAHCANQVLVLYAIRVLFLWNITFYCVETYCGFVVGTITNGVLDFTLANLLVFVPEIAHRDA